MPEPLSDLMESPQELYEMKLHDEIKIRECENHGDISVYRVPGGWIYMRSYHDDYVMTNTFVPWNSDERERPEFNTATGVGQAAMTESAAIKPRDFYDCNR